VKFSARTVVETIHSGDEIARNAAASVKVVRVMKGFISFAFSFSGNAVDRSYNRNIPFTLPFHYIFAKHFVEKRDVLSGGLTPLQLGILADLASPTRGEKGSLASLIMTSNLMSLPQ